MINLFKNAKEENKIYYCKHIAPGVCAYENETILIGEETLKEMDKTFAGKPIYVNHQKVNDDTMKQDAVGYVVKSFYLPEDGCEWGEMLIIDDKGHELIKNGWKVSNAYQPESFSVGGEWHNIPYQREVTKAHYTHLALVENPRYEEAVIMTPEEFKQYKEAKKAQLAQLQNSKPEEKSKQGENKMSWKLFQKKEVTNSEDISKVMVELSDGSAVSIAEMVNSVEEDLKKEAENKCNDDVLEKVVKVNGEDMTVKDLVAAFEKKNKKNEDAEEDEEKKDEKEEEEDKKSCKNEGEEEDKKGCKNADEDEEGEEKKDEDEEEPEEKKDKKNSKKILGAEEKANSKQFVGVVADTMARKLARGQERYGSAK